MAGLGPCPFAGQMLADLGARVILVERNTRRDFTGVVNRRGKLSICLDLKSASGREIVLRLAEKSDVLIEGYRPGVMERLGLGPQELRSKNPRIVYGRMTGWGQEGPLSHSAGHDITYLAITGALHAMGEQGRPPVPPLNLVADYGGGSMMLLTGVLAALIERASSGAGQVVDAAMVDGVPAMMGLIHSMIGSGLWTSRRGDNLLDGGAPFYRCYDTADGKFVGVGALEPQFFALLLEGTGLDPAWRHAQMDKQRWPELAGELEAAFLTRTRDQWAAVFESTDACVAPVLDFSEAATHSHNVARGTFFERDGVVQAAPAPRFPASNRELPQSSPAPGANYRDILADCGYSEAEIAALRAEGAVL